ncbi:predicted protein [Uncinocarpus reesii 1704]|uniref:Phosphatidylinositol transfer protein SFH5 n=1 Tax=Uncinocarpus reesii (strain UAMH 1704) TaxID=336963 RepID=C4JM05_UNCRE|nr:uncharacterized protein UREG_03863 [Uncinocarpus reesii 1704]EEP79017.1 predicted protein [Uncinocarpus reesii 1704]
MEKQQEQPTQTLPVASEQPAKKAVDVPQDATTAAAPAEGSQTVEKLTDASTKEESQETTVSPPAAETTDKEKSHTAEEVKDGAGVDADADAHAQVADATKEPADARPAYLVDNPALSQFFDRLAPAIETTGHNEMWGVTLKDAHDPPTANIMIKFLRANEGNVKLAEEQLVKALEWRKKMKPLALTDNTTFPTSKFGGLGYITTHHDANSGKDVVFTWNIYGSVKDVDVTFGNLEEFINWRVALMELAIRELRLGDATSVMDYNGEDPYQMIQVHDYQNVSFLRMNPNIRAASRQTIEVFSMAYPELLKEKYFVNVPVVMGWVFTALKVFLSKNTIRKFHPITNGLNLSREFSTFGEEIPKTYGGKGAPLSETGRTVALQDDIAAEVPANAAKDNGDGAQAPPKPEPTPADITKEPAQDNKQQDSTVTVEIPTDAPANVRQN